MMADTDTLLETIWQSLTEAATVPGHGLTLMNIATINLAGKPSARSVILRGFSRSPERIGFATHAQSEKVREIRANPAVAATCYDRERALQLRLEGVATVVEDDAERWHAWRRLPPHSQQQYISLAVPGEPFAGHETFVQDPSTAFQRFAWISLELQHVESLDLSADPHARWQFSRINNSWSSQRVIA